MVVSCTIINARAKHVPKSPSKVIMLGAKVYHKFENQLKGLFLEKSHGKALFIACDLKMKFILPLASIRQTNTKKAAVHCLVGSTRLKYTYSPKVFRGLQDLCT